MKKQGFVGFVYSLFIGIILAIFVGYGISAFYEEPQYDTTYRTDPAAEANLDDSQATYDAYTKENNIYSRNVMLLSLGASVVLLFVGLMVIGKKLPFAEDGFILGGLFTLLYSIIRGFSSEDRKVVFAVITVGILLTLYVGYKRFAVDTKPARKS